MIVSLNTYAMPKVSMGQSLQEHNKRQNQEKIIAKFTNDFKHSNRATIPPYKLMHGINPNQGNVFDTFSKIDDVTRTIGFVRSQDDWNKCLDEEVMEFKIARQEYEDNPTQQNYDHMQEEMGDIFYTAASIAKDSGLDPQESFRATNRKFFNRINLMERLARTDKKLGPDNLQDLGKSDLRALWNQAKLRIYYAQALRYLPQQNPSDI